MSDGAGPTAAVSDPRARPARPDDLRLVYGWRGGLGPLIAERWRQRGDKVLLVLPRAPGPDESLPAGLRTVVLNRQALLAGLADPATLLARAEPWRVAAGRRLNVPAASGLHLLDLALSEASDLLATLGALGSRPGRLLFLSDPCLLGRAGAASPALDEQARPDPETPAQESLLAAEQAAAQCARQGRVAVALRTAPYLYGPGLAPLTPLGPDARLPERLLRGDPLLWATGLTPTQPLHWLDLAEALEAALERPAPAPLYHLAGPETLSWDALLLALHRASGSPRDLAPERLTPAQLAQHKPEAARRFAELAHVPLLDDRRARAELSAGRRRLAEHAAAWLRSGLELLG